MKITIPGFDRVDYSKVICPACKSKGEKFIDVRAYRYDSQEDFPKLDLRCNVCNEYYSIWAFGDTVIRSEPVQVLVLDCNLIDAP